MQYVGYNDDLARHCRAIIQRNQLNEYNAVYAGMAVHKDTISVAIAEKGWDENRW